MYRFVRRIEIQNGKVPANLTDYPFLLNTTDLDLATRANGGHVENTANGGASGSYTVPADLVFSPNKDGSSRYDHEVEKYNAATGELVAWVRIPSVLAATDTVLYVCYGDSAVTTSQENVTGVWDTNFKAVWHLGEASGTIYDSTSNNNDGTAQGDLPTQIAGKVGSAQRFDGTGDYIVVGDADSLDFTTALTIELWMRLATNSVGGGLVSKQRTSYDQEDGYELYHHDAGDNLDFSGASGDVERCSPGLSDGVWYYVVNVYGASAVVQYVNNVAQGEDLAFTAATLVVGTDDLWIGARDAASQVPFDGDIDEIRLSGIARSTDYMTATHNNQSSPSTFYTLGDEVRRGVFGYVS